MTGVTMILGENADAMGEGEDNAVGDGEALCCPTAAARATLLDIMQTNDSRLHHDPRQRDLLFGLKTVLHHGLANGRQSTYRYLQ